MNSIETAAAGMIIGLVIKFFWDKWNKDYMTKKDCEKCPTKKLADEIVIIKGVLLELAIKAGIPTEKFKGLTE